MLFRSEAEEVVDSDAEYLSGDDAPAKQDGEGTGSSSEDGGGTPPATPGAGGGAGRRAELEAEVGGGGDHNIDMQE